MAPRTEPWSARKGGRDARELLRQVLSPPGKPPESRGQRAVPEELEGWHGTGSYGAGRGAPALLLDSGIRDPPIQGRLQLEAVLLHLRLRPGLCHLLQTLPGTSGESSSDADMAAAEGWDPHHHPCGGPGDSTRGRCTWQGLLLQHRSATHCKLPLLWCCAEHSSACFYPKCREHLYNTGTLLPGSTSCKQEQERAVMSQTSEQTHFPSSPIFYSQGLLWSIIN